MFSVRSNAWAVAEALGGFGLECFGSGLAGCARWVASILVPSVGAPGLAVACRLAWGRLKQGESKQYGFQHFSSIY